ncbi:MAG: exosome complex protein Rrp42 [Nanoarchaeota archaeon]|nr:exosome complex protein Rrp42 [Nanoarchaeota archaeon]
MNGDYIESLIEKGKRIDGRKLDEFRKIKIEHDVSKNAEGSARCIIGDTEVMVGVKMDIGEPYPDSPDEGTIIVSVELSPIASPEFESGPPGTKATELARIVDRGIRESKALDFKKLCIRKGEKIWMVFIDIYAVNDGGNLIDASVLAALAALNKTRIPKVEKDKVVYGEFTNKLLKLEKLPILITCYQINNKILLDPNYKEEKVINSRLSVSVYNGKIHALQKGGDETLSLNEIKEMIDVAIKKEGELNKYLK